MEKKKNFMPTPKPKKPSTLKIRSKGVRRGVAIQTICNIRRQKEKN